MFSYISIRSNCNDALIANCQGLDYALVREGNDLTINQNKVSAIWGC
jgi:hypothetical protein